MCALLCIRDRVNYDQNSFHQIVQCIRMPEINHLESDSQSLKQHWLLSRIKLDCLLASFGCLSDACEGHRDSPPPLAPPFTVWDDKPLL